MTAPDDDWRLDARCATTDPEIFFPSRGESTKEAKAICGRCTAAAECLQFAYDNHLTHGIFGGVTARARDRKKAA